MHLTITSNRSDPKFLQPGEIVSYFKKLFEVTFLPSDSLSPYDLATLSMHGNIPNFCPKFRLKKKIDDLKFVFPDGTVNNPWSGNYQEWHLFPVLPLTVILVHQEESEELDFVIADEDPNDPFS